MYRWRNCARNLFCAMCR